MVSSSFGVNALLHDNAVAIAATAISAELDAIPLPWIISDLT